MSEPLSTREIMGDTREGFNVKLEMTDHTDGHRIECYITGNLAKDGKVREVFLRGFGKEGSTMEGWASFASIALSLGLQAGVQLEALSLRLIEMKFPPYGPTTDPNIPWAPSVPAYVGAWLALRFGDEKLREAVQAKVSDWR